MSKANPTPEDCNCFAIRRAARVVTQLYDRHLAEAGLRVTQFGILARLHLDGPSTINALAAKMAMDRTTVARNIKPLQRDRMLTVSPDPDDGRSRTLEITAKGLATLKRARPFWDKAQKEFEGAVGSQPSASLRNDLRGVAHALPSPEL